MTFKVVTPKSIEEAIPKNRLLPDYEGGDELWRRLPRGASGEVLPTDALVKTFEKLLLEGNTRANSARVVGLQRTTLQRWMLQGQEDIKAGSDTVYARLTWTVDRCEGEQERRLVRAAMKVALSAASDGNMALKLLERRNPDDWAPALPDHGAGAESQFVGLSKQALREEAKKVLESAARDTRELPAVTEAVVSEIKPG